MNPFNPLSIVQSTFESADVQHELKELVEIIRAYDIYDIIAIQFGTHAWGSIDTRPFYTKPFLYDAGSDSYI